MLETVLGRARFLAVYLVSGLVGSATVMVFSDPHSQTLGASGAIFGLMGALVVVALKVGGQVQTVCVWIGLNLVFTFTVSGISWQGHVGGLVGGVVLGAAMVYAPAQTPVAGAVGRHRRGAGGLPGRGGAALRRPDLSTQPEKLSTPGDNPVENYTGVSRGATPTWWRR